MKLFSGDRRVQRLKNAYTAEVKAHIKAAAQRDQAWYMRDRALKLADDLHSELQELPRTRAERDQSNALLADVTAALKTANDALQQALARVDELENGPAVCLECGHTR